MGKPFYRVCKECLKEGDVFIANICEERERHMEQTHHMTGDRLEIMIKYPKLDFLSLDHAVGACAVILGASETEEEEEEQSDD